MTEQVIADALLHARRAGRGLAGFPGEVPADMASAYRIQDAAIAQWPDVVAGWKIGFIPADRREPGDPDRLVGPVWARQCHRGVDRDDPITMPVFVDGFAAVEAEIVVRLEDDPPERPDGGWTATEVAAVSQRLLVGIEVASSPIPDINALGPTVIAADFGNNNGLVIGPELPADTDPGSVALRCLVDDALIGEGSGASLPGGLHHGLATAWNVLEARGHPVSRGMVFATGATTGIHAVGAGQLCRVEAVGAGVVEVRTTAAGLRDYRAWHQAYDDPDSGLFWRLRRVQSWLGDALDERSGPVSVISVCSGEGRDILGVLADRSDADRITVTLVELDPEIAATARRTAAELGLDTVTVRQADAGHTDAYRDLGRADILLLVGIFGNVSEDDIRQTVAWAPQLCAPGATVVWSRGRDREDRNAQIRGWFAAAGFEEIDYAALDRDRHPALGVARYLGEAVTDPVEGRLFTFYR